MVQISEDQFHEQYQPLVRPGTDPDGGDYLWHHEQTLTRDVHHVWTVVETGDAEFDGWAYALPGYHVVNKVDPRVSYVVTTRPWTDEDVEAVWWEATEEEQARGHLIAHHGLDEALEDLIWQRQVGLQDVDELELLRALHRELHEVAAGEREAGAVEHLDEHFDDGEAPEWTPHTHPDGLDDLTTSVVDDGSR